MNWPMMELIWCKVKGQKGGDFEVRFLLPPAFTTNKDKKKEIIKRNKKKVKQTYTEINACFV